MPRSHPTSSRPCGTSGCNWGRSARPTCLFRGAVSQIVAAPGGADLTRAIVAGCAEIARACRHPPSDAFLAQRQADMTRAESPLTASMYRDLKKGAPVEADHILGDLLRRGREHGVDVPLLQAAYVNLRVYQDALTAPRHARPIGG